MDALGFSCFNLISELTPSVITVHRAMAGLCPESRPGFHTDEPCGFGSISETIWASVYPTDE